MSDYEAAETMSGTEGFDFEAALVTDILDNKTIRTAVKHKITADFMFGTQTKAAYLFLLQWFANPEYGDTPSWESFQHSFPEFNPLRVEESTVALCDKLREGKLYSDIAASLSSVAEAADGDPKGAFDMLKKQIATLSAAHTIDNSCDVRSRVSELREEYFAMKSGATGLKGHPYPWQALNDSTLGLQDQQVVFFYGRPKSGKTWLALEIIRNLHARGLRPIIFSQEMSDIEICRRFVALSTGVDYNAYLRGQLEPAVERDFFDNLDAFVESEAVIVDMITSIGEDAVLEMSTKIDEYKANVVLVDAVYALGQDWKELVAVMAGMKRTAKQKRIPIIGTTQANRSGAAKNKKVDDAADDFAYADAFYQWCDAAIRVTSDIEHKRKREAVLSTAALREGIPTTFTVNMHMANNLTQKAVLKVGGDDDLDDQIDQDKMDGQSDNPEEAALAADKAKPRKLISIPKPPKLVKAPKFLIRALQPTA